jgi:hypothetical protein
MSSCPASTSTRASTSLTPLRLLPALPWWSISRLETTCLCLLQAQQQEEEEETRDSEAKVAKLEDAL